MDFGLKGRVALVTGSSQGIGKACAIALAREGCNLYLCSKNLEKLRKTAQEIDGMGFDVHIFYHSVDVTKRDEIKNFIDQIPRLDILVNNAGGPPDKEVNLFGISEEEWIGMYKLNTLSALWFIEFAIPLLEKSNQARIINMGTKASHEPGYTNAHYCAAKSALDYLNKRISNELAPRGITVNIIGPHMLINETWIRRLEQRAKDNNITVQEAREITLREIVAKIPMGRQGTSEDAANLVVFLASAQVGFITGAYLPLDGGNSRARS